MSIAPVGGYLAVTGRWSKPWWLLCALATAVMTWGAGFDVLYALPDIAFDRAQGLHSIPVALGERGAIVIARALHVVTVLCLALIGVAAFPTPGFSGALLDWACSSRRRCCCTSTRSFSADDLSKLDAAFFTMNGVISLTLFAFVLAGRLMQRRGHAPHGRRDERDGSSDRHGDHGRVGRAVRRAAARAAARRRTAGAAHRVEPRAAAAPHRNGDRHGRGAARSPQGPSDGTRSSRCSTTTIAARRRRRDRRAIAAW